jgi:hypothetical protein
MTMTSPTIQDQETTSKRTLYQRHRRAAIKVKEAETARKARNAAYQRKAKEKKRVLNATRNTPAEAHTPYPTAPMANLDDGVSSNALSAAIIESMMASNALSAAIIESMMASLNGAAKQRFEELLLQAQVSHQNIQAFVREAVASGLTTGIAAGITAKDDGEDEDASDQKPPAQKYPRTLGK